MLKPEHIKERAEKLLSTLILLHRSEGKRMSVKDFTTGLKKTLPSGGRVYDALLKNKIVHSTGNPKDGWKVQYCTEVHPNIEMTTKIIQAATRVGERVKRPKKVVRNLPHTLYDKKEFKVGRDETPQEVFTHQITALKESFEKQYGAKVEILVEVTMTTTVQI